MIKALYIFIFLFSFSFSGFSQIDCSEKGRKKLERNIFNTKRSTQKLSSYELAQCYKGISDSAFHFWLEYFIRVNKSSYICPDPKGRLDIMFKMANSLYEVKNYKESETYFQKALLLRESIQATIDPANFLTLGICLYKIKHYQEAVKTLNAYLVMCPSDTVANKYIKKSKSEMPCLIKGYVFTDETDRKGRRPVKNVKVRLISSKGHMQEGITDSLGFYFIKSLKGAGTITLSTETSAMSVADKKGESFLATKDQFVHDLRLKDTIVQNLEVKPVPRCGMRIPEILFQFNSLTTVADTIDDGFSEEKIIENEEFTINIIKSIMIDNPTIVVEIDAHSDIMEIKDISIKRANYIANSLIKTGINAKRLVVKAYGAKEPLITEAEMKRAKPKAEKEFLRQKNRRATFKILNFSFEG